MQCMYESNMNKLYLPAVELVGVGQVLGGAHPVVQPRGAGQLRKTYSGGIVVGVGS